MYAPFVVYMSRVQYVVNPVQKADMDKTVPRSVSATTMVFVCRRPGGAYAAPGTQENGNIWQHCVISLFYLYIYFSCKTNSSEFTLHIRKLPSQIFVVTNKRQYSTKF